MNALLLTPRELEATDGEGVVRIEGRRAEHVRTVLRKQAGDRVRVGLQGGLLGEAVIESIDDASVCLRCTFVDAPPPKRAVTLVMALPRPLVLRRVLQHVAALGVPRIVLLHTARVDKSYWRSPVLAPAEIEAQLVLGLEQAVDTVLPGVEIAPRFRPFVEDRLPALARGTRLLVADPTGTVPLPTDVLEPATLVLGPEGGLVPYELEQLDAAGAERVHLGPRILRVETAIVAALARLGLV